MTEEQRRAEENRIPRVNKSLIINMTYLAVIEKILLFFTKVWVSTQLHLFFSQCSVTVGTNNSMKRMLVRPKSLKTKSFLRSTLCILELNFVHNKPIVYQLLDF